MVIIGLSKTDPSHIQCHKSDRSLSGFNLSVHPVTIVARILVIGIQLTLALIQEVITESHKLSIAFLCSLNYNYYNNDTILHSLYLKIILLPTLKL